MNFVRADSQGQKRISLDKVAFSVWVLATVKEITGLWLDEARCSSS
jgi:hypothetical protein